MCMCVCAFLVCFGYFRTLGINLQSNTKRKESEAAAASRRVQKLLASTSSALAAVAVAVDAANIGIS